MGYHGRFEAPKPKKKRGKVALIIFLILVVLIIGVVIAGLVYYNSMLDRIQIVETAKINVTTEATEPTETTAPPTTAQTSAATTQPTTVVTTEPPHIPSSEDYINILVVGQASRYGEEERFADTMILCTLNKYEKTLTMTSFLRDAFTKMPDYKGHTGGRIKLTTIYHLGSVYGNGVAGSMELMNQALYDNFGVEVDYNVELDFEAFTKIVDALGGLDVELGEAEAAYLNAIDEVHGLQEVSIGWNTLDGTTALHYARMRHADAGDSDIKRTGRQRQLISNLIQKLMTRSPSELNNLANEVLPMITTNMSKETINEMLLMMIPMLKDLQISMGGTCPVEGTYRGDSVDIYSNGQLHSVLRFEASQQKPLMRAITEGEVAE